MSRKKKTKEGESVEETLVVDSVQKLASDGPVQEKELLSEQPPALVARSTLQRLIEQGKINVSVSGYEYSWKGSSRKLTPVDELPVGVKDFVG